LGKDKTLLGKGDKVAWTGAWDGLAISTRFLPPEATTSWGRAGNCLGMGQSWLGGEEALAWLLAGPGLWTRVFTLAPEGGKPGAVGLLP